MAAEDPSERAAMLLERERQLREYNKVLQKVKKRVDSDTCELVDSWYQKTGRTIYGAEYTGLRNALERWPKTMIENAMERAIRNRKTGNLAYVHYILGQSR